jgi:hypothetical protein
VYHGPWGRTCEDKAHANSYIVKAVCAFKGKLIDDHVLSLEGRKDACTSTFLLPISSRVETLDRLSPSNHAASFRQAVISWCFIMFLKNTTWVGAE